MNDSYIKLSIAALLPVVATVLLYSLDKTGPFAKMKYWPKQILIGIVFGGLAIIGTEWGIPINGAQVNCRDAAVLAGGLLFGAPAGIIAGIIGGVERWIAVAWGVGTFTRVACSVSTILAGFYAAALRKYMFEDKKPGWLLSLAIGVVMEVVHLTMVFITNMATPTQAIIVVKACSVPMVAANGLSVMIATLAVSVLAREPLLPRRDTVRISQTIQRWLLITVFLAFAATSLFVFNFQHTVAVAQAESLLTQSLDDIEKAIRDSSDANLLYITRTISRSLDAATLQELADQYSIAEINVVDQKGIIADSTAEDFIGFDMNSGEQSAEFCCLLGETREYVQDYGPISYDSSISRKYAGVQYGAGFLQVGYDAAQFQKDIALQVSGTTQNRHVGQEGYTFILDERQNVVSAAKDLVKDIALSRKSEMLNGTENMTYPLQIGGTDYLCRYREAEGYYIVSVMPEEEVFQSRNTAIYVNTFMEIIVFAVLFALVYLLINRVVVNRIKTVNASLARITGGDLNEVVNVRSNEEFASLSDDINSTVATLKHYIDEASARIDKELEFAKNIQASALPNVFPAFPKRKDFDIYATMDPAKEVGGDFYDFYLTDGNTLNFLVADVSGKGIPAAMFMMRAKTELKTLTEAGMSIDEVFTRGNAALCEGNDAGMFVTAWQGGINLKNGLVQFANAGHNPPIVRHGDGKFEYLKSRAGFVLAGMDGVKYKPRELQLQPGDILYMYTDGVTEATNARNELYGEDRLLAIANSREFTDMQDLCRAIKADVDAFVGEAPQFDDITMVALRYIGTPEPPAIHFDAAQIADIPVITEFVEQELEKLECPLKSVMQIDVAIDEIYSNIVNHGYRGKPGPVTVKVVEKMEPHAVCIRFSDEAIPYNPLTNADPDVTLSAEERGIGGLGIYMVKKTMDDMKYKYENGQNVLTIIKNF